MTFLRISEVAVLLGASDDSVRRWCESGRLRSERDQSGRMVVRGERLAEFMVAQRKAANPTSEAVFGVSARNRFGGLVTRVVRDGVMAQVEMQAGAHRIVSLMSREAADELGLEPGSLAVASIKATNVVIESPPRSPVPQ